MDNLPLGEVLARALDAREAAAQAITPAAPTKPSLFTLARNENATSYIAQRRRDADRASRR